MKGTDDSDRTQQASSDDDGQDLPWLVHYVLQSADTSTSCLGTA